MHILRDGLFSGQANPFCCLPGLMYDVTQRRCITGSGKKCVNEKCPFGYFEGIEDFYITLYQLMCCCIHMYFA